MNNKIVKLQQGDYFKWKNLSREDKVKRNKQIAKQYLDKGPSIQNYYNALKAYFGGFNPKNPYLQTGEPIILPGTNPTKGMQAATKVARTLEDYLKTTKVTAQALEGSSAARSAYATDRYLGGVMFENNLPEAASQIQGHGMAKASTLQENLARLRYILDNGLEKGKTFFTAPLKVSDARIGSALGTGGGKPYFDGHFLITGKPGQMINSVDDIGTIYINDAYENEEALKAAQKMKEYLTKTYPNKVFKLYSEGFKKGGSIKFANARKWKHKEGGIIKAGFGQKLSNTVNKIGDFFNSNTGKGLLNLGMQAFGTIKGSIDANNYSNSFDAETNSQLKAIDASQRKNNYKQASQLASEIIKQKQQENPDIHYGPIDKQQLENQIANSLYNDSEMIKYQMQRAQEKQKQMEAIQGSSSGILDTVGGLLGNFIGNKKDTSTNTSSNNSTFGNYVSTQLKNYGTFNSDGSMNLGNGLGTFSITGGYKPQQFQVSTKFSL